MLEPAEDAGSLGSQSQGLISHDLVVFPNFNFEMLMDLGFFGRQSLWVLLYFGILMGFDQSLN